MFVSLKNGLSDLVAALVHRLTDQGVTLREAVPSMPCACDPISSVVGCMTSSSVTARPCP